MEKIIEEQIMRGVANQIAIQKAMGHDITDVDCLDMLEKAGRAAQIGDIRTWGGKDYIKTPKGWRPIPAGFKPSTKEEKNEAGEKKNDDWKVTPKSVTDKLKVGDHVMYAGKEMILTRISKDGRFDSGIEMKFANEGDKTPTGSTTKVGNMQYVKPVSGESGEKKETKDLTARKKEITSDVRELNAMSDRLEDLEDLMYGDEDDEVGSAENQSEYGDEYEELDEKFQKLAGNLKTSIREYMKDVNPDWKEPADSDVWDLIRAFNKTKAKGSRR